MWFKNSFRRHLLDMHINDWNNDVFFSEFSAEEYYNNLKKANVKSAMIYLQSHVGYCNYPTEVGHIHSAFKNRPYEIKKLINLCHAGGIDVEGYYSINYNSVEAKYHPEWECVPLVDEQLGQNFTGSRYGVCCPNNPEYMAFIKAQIKEILSYAELDGIFYDMPYWKYVCYCDHCKKKWRQEHGTEMPTARNTPEWELLNVTREKWTDQYLAEITDYTRSLKTGISVQYNYAFSVLNAVEYIGSEVINRHHDFSSGDLYAGFLTQSFACKHFLAVTPNKPFEYMTGRCDPSLECHTVTKSFDKLRLATSITMAHHGANFIIDAIDPVGTMDSRFYNTLGTLYKEVEHYEPYLSSGELLADVGLLYCLEARSMGEDKPTDHYSATLTTAKSLIQMHIPYGIFTQSTIDQIANYKALILANPKNLNENSVKMLKTYVENGGIIYFSGGNQPQLLSEFIKAELVGFTDASYTYLAPKTEYEALFLNFNAKYPLACKSKLPLIKLTEDSKVLATITLPYTLKDNPEAFSSIHSNPPGTPTNYPAIVVKNLGKGKIVWSAAGIEANKILVYQKILKNLLNLAGISEFSTQSTAARNVELITFKDEAQILVSTVYITDEEETEFQKPFEISVKSEKSPKKVSLLADGSNINFTYANNLITFKARELEIFDMYKIEFDTL